MAYIMSQGYLPPEAPVRLIEDEIDPSDLPNENMPPRICAALTYVRICNDNFGLRFYVHEDALGNSETRAIPEEMPPAQEGCFRHALGCLSRYFNGDLYGSSYGDAGDDCGGDGE